MAFQTLSKALKVNFKIPSYLTLQDMSVNSEADDSVPEIIGYADPWIVAPGDDVEIKVRREAQLSLQVPNFIQTQFTVTHRKTHVLMRLEFPHKFWNEMELIKRHRFLAQSRNMGIAPYA